MFESSSAAPVHVCVFCGAHFPGADIPPRECPICEDERGVPPKRQAWTTLEELRSRHRTTTRELEPGLVGIGTDPPISVGQRALLIRTRQGNILWDCIPMIDDAGVEAVVAQGGLVAIAVSHPHFYGAMAAWSQAFEGVPIYVHSADRVWVTHPDPAIVHWEGENLPLPGGITLIRCGGHFDGATLLHWPAGAEGRGVLLTGDPITVTPDRHVSFMYSYPNLIPLSAVAVTRVVKSVEPFVFDRIYGGWHRIGRDAKAVVARSTARYLHALGAGSGGA